MQRLRGSRFRIEQMPWGNLGPGALTALVKKNGLSAQVQPAEVLYPWTWQEAGLVFALEAQVLERIGPQTFAVHLYNQMIRERKAQPAPQGALLARLQRESA